MLPRMPPVAPRTRPIAAGETHPGLVRTINQDAFDAGWVGGRYFVAAVADGMGGHHAGEVASREALAQVWSALRRPRGDAPQALARATLAANAAVHALAEAEAAQQGMGTTLTALLLDDQVALIGQVGDSRAYRWRDGVLWQLSEDHSWVADRVRQGLLTEEEARAHRWRNVITSALGASGTFRFDLRATTVQGGDRFLLCSDGVTMLLTPERLNALMRVGTAEETARALIDEANALGSPDNVTAVVIDVPHVQERPKRYRIPDETAGPTRVRLGDPAAWTAIEEAFPHRSRWSRLRRAPWYPYRGWLLGSLYLVLAFVVFTLWPR